MLKNEASSPRGNRRHVAGSTLIILGAVLFLVRLFDGPHDTVVLLTVGGVFLAWYL